MAERDFTWQDGERTIRFGRGAIADAPGLLGDGYTLLATPRTEALAPGVVAAAERVHHVGPGRVDELAADLLDRCATTELFVALGGGRVIDTAKALAAARGVRAAAIPTTLSAAEMTAVHRQAAGAPPDRPRVRAAIVVNDPDLSASQPPAELAASAANSLAHAIEGPQTVMASPVPTLAGREAARLTEAAYAAGDEDPDREALALAAVLSGYAIDAQWYGLHHVLSQTLVRLAGAGHGPANAALLPHTTRALRERNPERVAAIDAVIGRPAEDLAADLARRAGATSLRAIGVDEAALDECADAAAQRPELQFTPPAAGRDELRAIYAAAL